MKPTFFDAVFFAGLAAAFPSKVLEHAQRDPVVMARANEIIKERQAASADGARAVFEPTPIFNAQAQYINVSKGSGHEFVAPGPDDLRGPCPGLNAFANHGFLPHNGWATTNQFIDATENVVGMGSLLAGFLSVYGAAIDGSGSAWSIGGTPTVAQGGAAGAKSNGISGSHNKYESDASPTRPDLYEGGNDYIAQVKQFEQLIAMSPNNQVTMDSLTKFRSTRWDTQVANNPYFFNGPFTGVLVQPAAYTFIYRFMANHSTANPEGLLSYDTLASWFAMSGSPGSYTYKEGWERIPDQWYRRPIEYPYESDYFVADLTNAALLYPKFASVGGNTGKVNSFTGVDVSNLTQGMLNAQSLTKGNNLGCFAYQAAAQGKPDLALNALSLFTNSLSKAVTQLSCPQLTTFDDSQLKQFPGYTKSG